MQADQTKYSLIAGVRSASMDGHFTVSYEKHVG